MAIEFKKSETTQKTYKVGDTFLYEGKPYILSQIRASEIILISLYDGNRYSDQPSNVKSINNITADEFNVCSDGQQFTPCDFILTEKK